jgi:hypothetical protein
MRNLVDPPPSLRCELCRGELRFKRIEPDDPAFDREVEIFFCVECSRVHSHRKIHNPYAAHTARSVSRGKVDEPGEADSNRRARCGVADSADDIADSTQWAHRPSSRGRAAKRSSVNYCSGS